MVCKVLNVLADIEEALSQLQVAIDMCSCDDIWNSLHHSENTL